MKDSHLQGAIVSLFYLKFTLIEEFPPPGRYEIKTTFDGSNPVIMNNTLTSNFNLQSSRDAYGKVYVPGGKRSPKGYENEPGPGHYSFNNRTISGEPPKISIHTRVHNVHDPFTQAKKRNSPGPGTYESLGIDKDGKYFVSNIR